MTTYPILDDRGQVFAFEIENTYVGVRTVARLLRSVDGVSGVEVRRLFSRSPDVHVVFRFGEQKFLVWEPYGDSSRYWIGPDDDARRPIIDLSSIAEAFRHHPVPAPVRLIGDLITRKWFHRRAK